MDELVNSIEAVAEVVWALASSVYEDEENEVFLNLSNDQNTMYISAFLAGNGINVNVKVFDRHLVIMDKTLDGGSYGALLIFFGVILDELDLKEEPNAKVSDSRILSFSEFIGDDMDLNLALGYGMPSFNDFLEDQEVDKILSGEPEIAFSEKNIA